MTTWVDESILKLKEIKCFTPEATARRRDMIEASIRLIDGHKSFSSGQTEYIVVGWNEKNSPLALCDCDKCIRQECKLKALTRGSILIHKKAAVKASGNPGFFQKISVQSNQIRFNTPEDAPCPTPARSAARIAIPAPEASSA